jgi:hypothetical protein
MYHGRAPVKGALEAHISVTISPRTAPSNPGNDWLVRRQTGVLPTDVIGCLQWSDAFESFHGHSDHEAEPLPMRDEGIQRKLTSTLTTPTSFLIGSSALPRVAPRRRSGSVPFIA